MHNDLSHPVAIPTLNCAVHASVPRSFGSAASIPEPITGRPEEPRHRSRRVVQFGRGIMSSHSDQPEVSSYLPDTTATLSTKFDHSEKGCFFAPGFVPVRAIRIGSDAFRGADGLRGRDDLRAQPSPVHAGEEHVFGSAIRLCPGTGPCPRTVFAHPSPRAGAWPFRQARSDRSTRVNAQLRLEACHREIVV